VSTPYPLGRDRAGVIVVIDGRLALIERVRTPESAPYWVVPGGGIEPGESPAETAIREAREELATIFGPAVPSCSPTPSRTCAHPAPGDVQVAVLAAATAT
jgi:8-oxo-dGTP pyrophosphatase MutT (NUDIX family)